MLCAMPRRCPALLLLLLSMGCAPGSVELTPGSGPMSGYYAVSADLAEVGVDPASVVGVTLGEVPAYDLVVDGDRLGFQVQGAQTPGAATLVLTLDDETEVAVDEAFRFTPPADPLFDRMYAMGASLTQGVQGGVPTQWAQLHSPGRYVSVQSGAYFALPLLRPGVFPSIGPEEVGPPPACTVPNVVDFIGSAAVDVLASINDVENDRLDFSLARVTPDLAPRNVAVGGSKARVVLDGPGDDFATGFLAKLVYDVHADVTAPVLTSQVDLVEAGDPTLVLLTDTFGNDLITAVVEGGPIDPDKLTDPEDLRVTLTELLGRLSDTGAQVFIANMPRATLLPATDEKVRSAVEAARSLAVANGEDPDAAEAEALVELEGLVAQVDAAGLAYNQVLDEVAAAHDNVHVVDFFGEVERVEAEGLAVGDQTLSVLKLDGLLSTDGVHFSDVGYGMVANLFLDAIADELGVVVPPVDLVDLLAQDPFSPANLAAAGLDPTACDPR